MSAGLLRRHGVINVSVYSSQWCRCRDTAQLLGLGSVQTLSILNSLQGRSQAASRQTAQLRGFIAATRPGQPSRVLINHQSNIRALTGRNIGSGAILEIRASANGGIKVLGTIPAP